MRMREILEVASDDLAMIEEQALVKSSDLRRGAPLTLRTLNSLKRLRAFRRQEAAERRGLLPVMYGDAEPDEDDLKNEKSELDIQSKRLGNEAKAMDVQRKKKELDGASDAVVARLATDYLSKR